MAKIQRRTTGMQGWLDAGVREHESCYRNTPMPDQDFFGLCTSLKPLVRKAIGVLSQVRHLGPGQTIYAPGDPGDTFYIISRGVIDAFLSSAHEKREAYLSRGDLFADAEVLTELL